MESRCDFIWKPKDSNGSFGLLELCQWYSQGVGIMPKTYVPIGSMYSSSES